VLSEGAAQPDRSRRIIQHVYPFERFSEDAKKALTIAQA
jgi:hypothetical protein